MEKTIEEIREIEECVERLIYDIGEAEINPKFRGTIGLEVIGKKIEDLRILLRDDEDYNTSILAEVLEGIKKKVAKEEKRENEKKLEDEKRQKEAWRRKRGDDDDGYDSRVTTKRRNYDGLRRELMETINQFELDDFDMNYESIRRQIVTRPQTPPPRTVPDAPRINA